MELVSRRSSIPSCYNPIAIPPLVDDRIQMLCGSRSSSPAPPIDSSVCSRMMLKIFERMTDTSHTPRLRPGSFR